MHIIFVTFIIATLVEIYTIIKVGEVIGGFYTILLIIITAIIGSFLLKQQGLSTLNNAQLQMQKGESPAFEMLEGIAIIISGILLLTPGFITDFIGILGLIPTTRRYGINYFIIKNNYKKPKDDYIEGKFWKD